MMPTATRRDFLQLGSVVIVDATVRLKPDTTYVRRDARTGAVVDVRTNAVPDVRTNAMPDAAASARTSAAADGNLAAVKALTFDTFGTVVDYRSTIIAEGTALGKAKGLKVDWAAFADAWRAGYAPAMNRVRTGELPWTKLDRLHRMTLDRLLVEFKITGL